MGLRKKSFRQEFTATVESSVSYCSARPLDANGNYVVGSENS